jgi:hypothetical protein
MAMKDIYDKINNKNNTQTKVTISYFEVYQEKIYDLLGEGSQYLEVRDGPDNKTIIVGLLKKSARNYKEALEIYQYGEKRRKYA